MRAGVLVLLALLVAAPAAEARRAPSYHSPGYKGAKHLPKVAPVTPPKPVSVATDGQLPQVLVDDAGTAHLAWSQYVPYLPSIIHYCRIPRGGRSCASSVTKTPLQPYTAGNGPATDIDFNGPFPLRVGNELLLLDARCCNESPTPGGGSTGNPTYLYTSEDGGDSFTGHDEQAGSAGVVGTQEPSGNAIVYGGSDPSIGVVSDTQTGGTFFQGIPAGSFTDQVANLADGTSQNAAYSGRVAVDGTRPVVAFDDLDGNTWVREWTGRGSVNDASTWSKLEIGKTYDPRLVGGASGLVLMSHTELLGGTLQVRRLAPGAGRVIGKPAGLGPLSGTDSGSFGGQPEIAESPGGRIAVAGDGLVGQAGHQKFGVGLRTSTDGVHFSPLSLIARAATPDIGDYSVGLTDDGGGFVTYADTSKGGSSHSRIDLAQFGATGSTGRKGLGLVPGGSGPPGGDKTAYATCSKVHFGDVDALTQAGCFLRDPANQASGAAVTAGPLRLNGLDIVPDAGVKIAIDPRQHSIDTTGSVRVLLEGDGVPTVTLWHGSLHVKLSVAGDGQTLFDFDMSQFNTGLEGFPLTGRIQVKLVKDGVDIPVHVGLPAYFGGVHGDADLKADNATGLHLDSLHIGIDDANVGVLELKGVHLDYTRTGDTWDGGGELILPGPTGADIKVDVTFTAGQFKHGEFDVKFPPPGIAVFTDVYLHGVSVGFGLHPTVIEGGVSVGAIPLSANTYTVDVVGRIKIQVGDASHPTIVFVGGTGAVLGFDLVNASFTYNSDGYVLFHVGLDYGGDSKWASLSASGDVFVLHGDFGANLNAHGCLVYVCAGLEAAASHKGLSVCDSGEDAGADLPDWDPTQIEVHLTSCHISDYRLQAPPAGGASVRAGPAERTFTVAQGQSGVDLDLHGSGGAPNVTLVAPNGTAVTPAAPSDRAASVIGVANPNAPQEFIGLRHPQAGTWSVRPNGGSPAIASLSMAHDVPLPTVKARVTGRGARRTLHYTLAHVAAGTKVTFAERAKEGTHVLGVARGTKGTLRFSPAQGAGGRRAVLGVVTQGGYTRAQPVVAHYTAPRLRKPARVGRVRLTRRGTKVLVRFGAAAGAFRYRLRVSATGGVLKQRTTRARRLTVGGLRRGARIAVTVRGVNVRGQAGRARSAVLKAPKPKSHKKHKKRKKKRH